MSKQGRGVLTIYFEMKGGFFTTTDGLPHGGTKVQSLGNLSLTSKKKNA